MSQKLPALRPKQVFRMLQRAGFFLHHVSGSHCSLKHHVRDDCRITRPWHNRHLKRGTLASSIEKSGLTVDEFRALI